MNTVTVLYIEDNPVNAHLVVKQMRNQNIQIMTADTASEGINMAKTHRPDMILMDFNLPDMNGLEAMGHIRSIDGVSHIPVVMLTADYTEETKTDARDMNVDGYLLKPVKKSDLLETIQRLTG